MKRLRHPSFGTAVPLGRLSDVSMPHPERTATKPGTDWGTVEIGEWPSVESMLTAVRMSQRQAPLMGAKYWRPVRPEERERV